MKKNEGKAARKRGGRPRALAEAVNRITAPVFARRGLAEGAIVREWPAIVGPFLASRTLPERIVFRHDRRDEGTLHIRVDGGSLALELQHLEPQVIERVNGYFGYRAVADLRLTQGALPAAAEPPPEVPHPLDRDQEDALAATVAGVENEELRMALESLGRAVMERENQRRRK